MGKLSNNNENKTPHLLSQPRHHRPDATQEETSAAQDNWQSYGWQEYEDEKSWDWQWSDRASIEAQASPENRDGEIRQPPTPPSKRSRSTQVTDGLEANQPVASATLPHTPQLQRLHAIVEHLESLAKQGLPTMLEAFQRSDYQTSMHDDFHNDEATAHWPRVGNWNLALTGSLLCPFFRVKYNNVRKLGDFMESFTVCKAREQPVADWFPQYTELVQLVSDLVGACSQAVHDSLQWNMNPAELRDRAPLTPPPSATLALTKLQAKHDAEVLGSATEEEEQRSPTTPMDSPVEQWEGEQWEEEDAEEEVPVVEQDEDIQIVEVSQASHKQDGPALREPAWAPPAAEQHRLIGGTETWMRQFGVPASVRGSRAMEVSKALTQVLRHTAPRIGLQMGEDGYVLMDDLLQTPCFWNQWIREEEIVDVIHYNKKSRFQVGVRDGRYLVRAMQGHSIVHVRDELLLTLLSEDEAPEYAAHGTYYDFYESILKHGLVAGGQQGAAFRRHIHMVATLPWEGPISGMRNSCDILIWIRTRQAVAEGAIRLYRSANDVFLTEDAVGPRFFHSVQVLSTRQVLLSKDEPPRPPLVALAVSRRYMR
ncbi:TRPT1, partial [Symbiodinium necroappetens]